MPLRASPVHASCAVVASEHWSGAGARVEEGGICGQIVTSPCREYAWLVGEIIIINWLVGETHAAGAARAAASVQGVLEQMKKHVRPGDRATNRHNNRYMEQAEP